MSINPPIEDLSKRLSYVLRHKPGSIGITLDAAGWADVTPLLIALGITNATLDALVASCPKQRFAFSPDGTRIRANQGHSISVDLGLSRAEPPEMLYHGTASRFVEDIRLRGLQKGKRQHVHLSPDTATAREVGLRYGAPVILIVHARSMHEAKRGFWQTANGVWLTDHVPNVYITFPETR